MEDNKKIYKLLLAFVVILAVGGVGWYFYDKSKQVNYLIPGVPYHGIFNHYALNTRSSVTNIMMILEYYGDERFSRDELMNRFNPMVEDDTLSLKKVQQFFEENGYNAYWAKPGGEVISEIKKFVNQRKKIPVIVLNKRSPDPRYEINVYTTVIGIYDKEKKLIVHDYSFGNNYEISYDDFINLHAPRRFPRTMLAVWPSENLATQLKHRDIEAYPPRLPAMDIVGTLFAKAADHHILLEKVIENPGPETSEELVQFSRRYVTVPRFESMHPLVKINAKINLVRVLRQAEKINPLGRLDESIQIIVNEVLPLNRDLDQPYQGWTLSSKDIKNGQVAFPYVWLGMVYADNEDFEKAFDSFEAAWAIDTSDFPTVVHGHPRIPTAYLAYERTAGEALQHNPANIRALEWLERIKKARLEGAD